MAKDRIYASSNVTTGPFEFNEAVARVFPDMLRRSIPGYEATIECIGSLAERYVTPGSNSYDLGCSLGAATLAMRHMIRHDDCRIIAVDNAPAMVERCQRLVDSDDAKVPVDVQLADVMDVPVKQASMVVMNYTLQFLPAAARQTLLDRIWAGLLPGGVFVLSEKVVDEDPVIEELLADLHLEHKRRNEYSAMEIARKRTALENVLVPESLATHCNRLRQAGFAHVGTWQRHFNFLSIVAIK